MSDIKNQKKDMLTPPGGLMIWIFSFSEIFVFICAIGTFFYERQLHSELFFESRLKLNQLNATFNTVILISSSYFVASAVRCYDIENKKGTLKNLVAGISLGFGFLIIKLIEYYDKISNNLVLGSNIFFDYYWILTSFHAIHVALGVLILLWLLFYTYKDREFKENDMNFHTGANYWHLCDLIWLIIFPALYLL